jgi:hypothetical protein
MVVNYVTNAPTSVNWLWAIAKNFLADHTVKKIKINKAVASLEISRHINPAQLEAKYGGTAPNVQTFWPPTIPEGPFATPYEDPESYLSQVSSYEEYFPPLPDEESYVAEQVSDVVEQAIEEVEQAIEEAEEVLEVVEEILPRKKRSRQRPEPDNTALQRPRYIQDKEFAAAFAHHLRIEEVIEASQPTVQESKRRQKQSLTIEVEEHSIEVVSEYQEGKVPVSKYQEGKVVFSEYQEGKVVETDSDHSGWSLCRSCRLTSVTCSLI